MVWNGADMRPLPPPAAVSSTNQITGPLMVRLMLVGADVAVGPDRAAVVGDGVLERVGAGEARRPG